MSLDKIQRLTRRLFAPVAHYPKSFIALTILGFLSTLLYAAIAPGHIIKLLVFAFVQSTAWSYLWCAILSLIKSSRITKTVNIIVLAVYSFIALADTATVATTGVPISIDELNLFSETTLGESKGFFQQYLSGRAILLITIAAAIVILPLFAVGGCKKLAAKHPAGKPAVRVLTLCFVIFGWIRVFSFAPLFMIDDYSEFLVWESEPRFDNPELSYYNQIRLADATDKVICYSKELHLQNGEYTRWEETQRNALEQPCTAASDREFNIIVIIGESFIRRHSSLYGYHLPTDPRMKAEADSGRVAIFTDMISPANFTTYSVRNLLSLNDLTNGQRWADGVYFPLLMRQSGRSVYHYDNQTSKLGYDAGISRLFYNDINLLHTYNMVSDSCFTYDGEFVDYLERKFYPQEAPRQKLVIYHLEGQHFPAAARYPGDGPFDMTDIPASHPWMTPEARREVAEYDNATRYTDSIVGRILDRYKSSPSIVVYFSDHGEDIWDLAPTGSRNKPNPSDAAWIDRQFHIPFFVWMSDSFQGSYPGLAAAIRKGAARPGSLDHLGQMVIGLAGIHSPYYNPKLDITSPQYDVTVRKTAEGYLISSDELTFP